MDDPKKHPRVVVAAGDLSRQYSSEEEQRLAANLRDITAKVFRGAYAAHACDDRLLRELHAHLFATVRSHAGRFRATDYGTEYLTFGPNRSASRSEVQAKIAPIFADAALALASFRANPDSPDYEESALRLAAWLQAGLIEIHPFEDGNGRSTRLLTDWLLLQLGLRPIPMEAVKDEYNQCLNHYFATRDLQPLVDLFIRLYVFD